VTIRSTIALAAALVFAVALAPGAAAHKFHASLAEVELNGETGRLEISMRLFADDLERALERRAGKRVRLDATREVGPVVLEYLRDSFVVRDAEGDAVELAWVGMEARVDEVWVFVEAAAPRGVQGARIADRVFFELFSDQVNTVNVKSGAARTSLVFTPGDGEKVVELPLVKASDAN
jgi:hypothetical protein